MANITQIKLLNVPLENDYKHTFYFASKSEQETYFKSREVMSSSDFSYQRKDNFIRYPAQYDELKSCNYVMYRNDGYDKNKWYYAFITKKEYVNDDRTDLYIETDVMQTWAFDYEIKASFIEREHVSDDTIGLHTVPEQLETGDYIVNAKFQKEDGTSVVVVGSTVDLNSEKFQKFSGGMPYNGIFSGLTYSVFSNQIALAFKLMDLAEAGKSDAIVSMFMCGSEYLDTIVDDNGGLSIKLGKTNSKQVYWGDIKKPTKIDGYTPKNNKLFTFPYTYLLVSNNSGGSAIYQFEYFKQRDEDDNFVESDTCHFYIYSAITPGMSIRLVPSYYKGVDYSNEEGLNLGKYPICSWPNDVYINWLTQNGLNIGMNIVGQVAGVATGAIMGGGVGAAAGAINGVVGIGQTIGEIDAHSYIPPHADGNINSGDVTFANGDLTFTAYSMCIKKEFAKIIDMYFTMYGYKVNTVKVPNTNHREGFWFTKTIDVSIDNIPVITEGDENVKAGYVIPMEDMNKIKNCYNTGITFWKYKDIRFGDYYQSNNII